MLQNHACFSCVQLDLGHNQLGDEAEAALREIADGHPSLTLRLGDASPAAAPTPSPKQPLRHLLAEVADLIEQQADVAAALCARPELMKAIWEHFLAHEGHHPTTTAARIGLDKLRFCVGDNPGYNGLPDMIPISTLESIRKR